MPDPLRQTISATEAPGLFNASPYCTRWMLYQRFANGLDIDGPEHSRMNWGTRMEPLVLGAAAEDLKLEVTPNRDGAGEQHYVRNGLLGCTRDATIICPDRGPGALETKCVFDYRVWMESWGGGKQPPRHIEVQLQQQMMVGDGVASYGWGVLAVWCCGDMFYFERKPLDELWGALTTEAEAFFDQVKRRNEPAPFGIAEEAPLLAKLYPPVAKKVRDYTEEEDAVAVAESARVMAWHNTERLIHDRGETALKDRFRALLLDNEELLLPHGIIVRQRKHGRGIAISTYVPENLPDELPKGVFSI